MIVLIDNYDSFTYNIYDYVSRYRPVTVFRNKESLDQVKSVTMEGIILSPGPSHPAQSLLTLEVIDCFAGKVPILGVCLGMQAIAYAFGNRIRRARRIMHGKVDTIENRDGLLLAGLGKEFTAVRYHSLVVDIDQNNFEVSAISKSDDEAMAIENRALGIFGLQFHPESYATHKGLDIIENFLEVCYGKA
jgi:anthranilate synthase/aminodeoxychorismate synthase-like glutamine amidotransferase